MYNINLQVSAARVVQVLMRKAVTGHSSSITGIHKSAKYVW